MVVLSKLARPMSCEIRISELEVRGSGKLNRLLIELKDKTRNLCSRSRRPILATKDIVWQKCHDGRRVVDWTNSLCKAYVNVGEDIEIKIKI